MLAGDTGLEPVNDGVKVRCLTDLANPQYVVVGEGFEPSKTQSTDLQSAPFGHSGTPPFIFKSTRISALLSHSTVRLELLMALN